MIRLSALALTLVAFAFLVHVPSEGAVQKKNQMVKGTIKSVSTDTDVLVISQKVKNETVDRELSIETTTEFIVTLKDNTTKTATGSAGLKLLENAKGAMVQVKCDKDVKVLQVKATIK